VALDAAHGADPSSWFQVPKGVPDNVARSRAGTAEPLADTVEARARDATKPRELGRARGPETRHSEESRVERLRPERRHDSCSDRGCFQGAMLLAGPLRGRAPATDGFHEESCFAGKLLRTTASRESCFAGKLLRTTASRESCFAGKLPRTTASTEGRFEGAASTALAHRSLVGRSKAKKKPHEVLASWGSQNPAATYSPTGRSMVKPHGRLVLVSFTALALQPLHTQPINVVVFDCPLGDLRPGIPYLEGGFPLRCFQRLSFPYLATQRCPGMTTGSPEVRPFRSSRTKKSSPSSILRPRRIGTELSHDVLNPARVPL
jgi:hypothetical protein